MYPTPDLFIEELVYKDENDFEWRIARIEGGFMVKFFGVEYFTETYFDFTVSTGKHFLLNNTGCIFFKDTDFETFAEMRDVLKNGYTDEIWEVFEDLFTERFEQDESILECEVVH